MKLEESLKGGFPGLYGEVVTHDCYRLKKLDFKPDTIFDIGANVGVFTRFARSLWPDARIIAVEPDAENCAIFREYTDDHLILHLEKALGRGSMVYRGTTARNGSGEVYMSPMIGYTKEELENEVRYGAAYKMALIETVTLADLVDDYADGKCLLKLDCEGAENSIWDTERELLALRRMEYIAGEIHYYSHTGAGAEAVRTKTKEALKFLSETHNYKLDHVHLWARKR